MKTSTTIFNRSLYGFLAAFIIVVTPLAAQGQLYSVVNIGSLGGNIAVTALNDNGVVGGGAMTPDGNEHPVIFANGQLTELPVPLEGYTAVTGINDANEYVGVGYLNANTYSQPFESFVDENGTITIVSNPGGTTAISAVNNAGISIGGFALNYSNFYYDAFEYANGVFTDLGTPNGARVAYALAINNAGVGVGYYFQNSNQNEQAVSITNGTYTSLGPLLGGNDSNANAINLAGNIVGWSLTASGAQHAFDYYNGTVKDLGTLGGNTSIAQGINKYDAIVGYATTANGIQDAFLDVNGQMLNLNTLANIPNVTLSDAVAINDAGQIAVQGNNGQAYLLTPIIVPEPATYVAIFGAAVFGLAIVRKCFCRNDGFGVERLTPAHEAQSRDHHFNFSKKSGNSLGAPTYVRQASNLG